MHMNPMMFLVLTYEQAYLHIPAEVHALDIAVWQTYFQHCSQLGLFKLPFDIFGLFGVWLLTKQPF